MKTVFDNPLHDCPDFILIPPYSFSTRWPSRSTLDIRSILPIPENVSGSLFKSEKVRSTFRRLPYPMRAFQNEARRAPLTCRHERVFRQDTGLAFVQPRAPDVLATSMPSAMYLDRMAFLSHATSARIFVSMCPPSCARSARVSSRTRPRTISSLTTCASTLSMSGSRPHGGCSIHSSASCADGGNAGRRFPASCQQPLSTRGE